MAHVDPTNNNHRLHKYGAIAAISSEEGQRDSARHSSSRHSFAPVALLIAFIVSVALFMSRISSRHHEPSSTTPLTDMQLWVSPHPTPVDKEKERFYDNQLVDHFAENHGVTKTWSNRYYQSTKYFAGPGHPLFLIVGGESAMDDGLFYPFVTEVLAKKFQAAVVQIEHRFYGPYRPIENATSKELLQLLTPRQAMADMIRLMTHLRKNEFHCSSLRDDTSHYCPIITVGASYPGFLSAMFRLVYPDVVDIAYAGSAPLLMYAQAVNSTVYYDIITAVADRMSPGCADAVRSTLQDVSDAIRTSTSRRQAAERVGVCPNSIPAYMTNQEMLREGIIQITSYKFADDNMDAYPPGVGTELYKTCQIFQNNENTTLGRIKVFLMSLLSKEEEESVSDTTAYCFDLMTQLPKGGITLEDTDGDYLDGVMWDFQTCYNIVFLTSFSVQSMFPAEEATYEHLTEHCRQHFGISPRPYELVEEWGFDDLSNASYILFTNGRQDMWSGGSYMWNVSDTVIALNFENGCHHSELSSHLPSDKDTNDIRQGYVQIEQSLAKWLRQINNKK